MVNIVIGFPSQFQAVTPILTQRKLLDMASSIFIELIWNLFSGRFSQLMWRGLLVAWWFCWTGLVLGQFPLHSTFLWNGVPHVRKNFPIAPNECIVSLHFFTTDTVTPMFDFLYRLFSSTLHRILEKRRLQIIELTIVGDTRPLDFILAFILAQVKSSFGAENSSSNTARRV